LYAKKIERDAGSEQHAFAPDALDRRTKTVIVAFMVM